MIYQIVRRRAIKVIGDWDSSETLIYADHHLHSTRSKRRHDVYNVEMTERDHRELVTVLNSCKNKVVLSGYPCGRQRE